MKLHETRINARHICFKKRDFALISSSQIARPNLQILHLRVQLFAHTGKFHDKACSNYVILSPAHTMIQVNICLKLETLHRRFIDVETTLCVYWESHNKDV